MDSNDKTLFEVLRETGCNELPDKIEGAGKKPWVYAIGDVTKYDGSKSYVILRSIDGESYRIFKDFGPSAKIVKIDAIRPYMPLYARYTPAVLTKDDIVAYIVGERWKRIYEFNGDPNYNARRIEYMAKETEAVNAMSNIEIRREFYRYCIEAQIVGIKSRIADQSKFIGASTNEELVDIDGVLVRKEVAGKVQQLKEYQNKVNGKDTSKESEKSEAEVAPDAGNTQSDENESKSVARRVRKVIRKN